MKVDEEGMNNGNEGFSVMQEVDYKKCQKE